MGIQALCRTTDPDELFVRGAAGRGDLRHCPVMQSVRQDALDNKVEFGVWGGMTERQRGLCSTTSRWTWSDYEAQAPHQHRRIATQGLRIGAAVPSLLITVWLQQSHSFLVACA